MFWRNIQSIKFPNIDTIKTICYNLFVNGDGTHNKKQLYSLFTRGMIPIEKNIIVVDEQGNEYEATYPKRAKGLVKNGRARFIEENKICLMCPPNSELEDDDMPNTSTTKTKAKDVLTIKYVLEKTEQIMNDTEYIHSALERLALMPKSDPGDIAGQAKATAIGEIVRCREATNQQALKFYEKMNDDLVGKKVLKDKDKALAALEKYSGNDEQMEKLSGIMSEIGFLEE